MKLRDPVSGLTHLAGALLGVFGLVWMQAQALLPAARISTAVYGASLVALYSASSAYHLLDVSAGARLILRRLDHSMVGVFIAGTYTPFCVLALQGTLGTAVLAVIWTLALAALAKSVLWLHSPRWVTAGLYVLMGWVVVAAAVPLYKSVTPDVFWLVFAGGALYSIGALVYAVKWPDPFPPHFGFHEVWHLFVLGGSACHFVSVALLI